MATAGSRLFIAWSTVREGKAQLYLALSEDGGKHFGRECRWRREWWTRTIPSMLMVRRQSGGSFSGQAGRSESGLGTGRRVVSRNGFRWQAFETDSNRQCFEERILSGGRVRRTRQGLLCMDRARGRSTQCDSCEGPSDRGWPLTVSLNPLPYGRGSATYCSTEPRVLASGLSGLLLLALCLSAQVNTAEVSGTIFDQSRGTLRGVEVSLMQESTGAKRVAHTDGARPLFVSAPCTGLYRMNVKLEGFDARRSAELCSRPAKKQCRT